MSSWGQSDSEDPGLLGEAQASPSKEVMASTLKVMGRPGEVMLTACMFGAHVLGFVPGPVHTLGAKIQTGHHI